VSGGGTAGHIYPALTVAGRLRADGHDVAFVGTPDGLEARIVAEAGVTFHAVRSQGFDRGNPLTLLTSGVVAVRSVFYALRLLARTKPDVVIGFGGYVSLPVGMAAVLSRTPLVLHEQNSVPGLANKVLSRWAHSVGVTYESSAEHLMRGKRIVMTGNPVRDSVLHASRERGRAELGLSPDSVVVLAFGGSRGAQHLNEAMADLAPRLAEVPSLQVVHVAGRIGAADVQERIEAAVGSGTDRYRVAEYIDAMGDAIAAADLVIARAGATSIAELTAIGRAAILVPYPFATDDHQTGNARALAEAGGARVVADAELDGPVFADAVMELVSDGARRDAMARASESLGRRDAAERVAELAVEAAGTRKETR
jgi:UDP-N-acetylglucosamine--N-acetylmuramyl-(pentapeptide) pyrophosphoryl-undecaprenol N-acetylglucosamine transferase